MKIDGEMTPIVAKAARASQSTVCDADERWQKTQSEQELTQALCSIIDEGISSAIPFRRRDYESDAMMRALFEKGGLTLPKVSRTVPSTGDAQVLVICNSTSAESLLTCVRREFPSFNLLPVNCQDAREILESGAAVDQIHFVLLLLTEGVFANGGQAPELSLIEQTIGQFWDPPSGRDKIVTVYSEQDGWCFVSGTNGLPLMVKDCIAQHEALAYRSSATRDDKPYRTEHEEIAFVAKLRDKLVRLV